MAQKWHGPSDSWPDHGKSWFREALAVAREDGWHLLTFSGHSFGKVVCSRRLDEPCEKLILSTGADGEHHAKDLIALVNRCRHERDDEAPFDYADVRKRMAGVELLLAAAERCLDDELKQARSVELLEMCEEALEDVDELLTQVIQIDEDHQTALVEIYGMTARAEYPADAPHTSDALVDSADQELTEVEAEVESAPHSTERDTIRAEVQQLRERLAALGARSGHAPG